MFYIYLKNEDELYIIHEHNNICNGMNIKIYENLGDITSNAYKFSEFKEILLLYLNSNPLTTYNKFKKYGIKQYLENNYKVAIKKNIFNNIFYEWRKKAKIFNWYSIFDTVIPLMGKCIYKMQ